MKLYLLRPNPWYAQKQAQAKQVAPGFIIRADNALRAREIAYKETGNAYWPLTWLDETYSTCVELNADGQEEIISDFLRPEA